MLEVSGLTMAYGPISVVEDLHLEVGEGTIVAVVGRNGAGKSTTLNGITGVVRPLAGRITFQGKDLVGRSVSNIARRGIAYVPEGRGVLPGLSVLENLETAAYGHGLSRRAARVEISRAIGHFPVLESRVKQRAGSLSGGEQQMLAVSRALVSRPKLLLVDEPGIGLSPLLVSLLYESLVALNADEGLSVLLVEQYVHLALSHAHHAYVLEKGRVVLAGSAQDVSTSPELEKAYVG